MSHARCSKKIRQRNMLYWILLIFIVVGFFYPIVGLLAIVCMIAPVAMSVFRGRYWCGHFCPRGNYYDKLISKISRNRKIPDFIRSRGFRGFMLFFIFAMFGIQMYFAWGDWSAMGGVFWNIIFITTVVAPYWAFSIRRERGARSALWEHYLQW